MMTLPAAVGEALDRLLGVDPADQGDVVDRLRALIGALNGTPPLEAQAVRTTAVRICTERQIPDARRFVDAAFAERPGPNGAKSDELQGQAVALADPEPWREPVDGAALLAELVRTFARFVALPEGAATAIALWILHAHAHTAAQVSPLLALTSPEKKCGKTTTLTLLGALVPRSLIASSISPAALFRVVERYRPALLVDEADTVFRDNDELRTLMNASHHRAAAVAVRTVGEAFEARTFSTWCPKAVALIGALPGTLEDRAILLRLRRRRPDEPAERLRLDRLAELEPLRRQAWRWAQERLDALRAADPLLPAALGDRAQDNWRPLVAIADLAGGPWPERARRAATLLSGGESEGDQAPAVQLLADVRDLFR